MSGYGNCPGIRVYYCRNCTHAGEIPAAVTKRCAGLNVTVEAVPCSGRVDPRYILKAFEAGTQAVCVLACPTGTCKLMEGNLRTSRRVQAVREILSEVGLDPNSMQIHVPTNKAEDTLEAAMEVVSRTAAKSNVCPRPVANNAHSLQQDVQGVRA